MSNRMTIEQMWQKGNEARREAKALQRKLQTITDPEKRKQIAQQMNDLFTQASELRNEAKHRQWFEKSVDREFISIQADLEDD